MSTHSILCLPPSNQTGSSLGRRSTLLLTWPLRKDSLHELNLANSYGFLPNRNCNHTCNHLRKNNSRRLPADGLHMPPHLDSRHHHFFVNAMHFPRVPPSPANCSSLEVMILMYPNS